MESGVVMELQYDTPLRGLQAPGFSIPFRKTVVQYDTPLLGLQAPHVRPEN